MSEFSPERAGDGLKFLSRRGFCGHFFIWGKSAGDGEEKGNEHVRVIRYKTLRQQTRLELAQYSAFVSGDVPKVNTATTRALQEPELIPPAAGFRQLVLATVPRERCIAHCSQGRDRKRDVNDSER